MHKSISTLIAVLGLGLALAPSAMADEATADLMVARDDCGATDNPRLAFDIGAYTDACGSLAPLVAPFTENYSTATLNPLFGLDTSRPGKIAITMSSRESLGTGLGDQTIDLTLTAKDTKNKTVTLFTGSHVKAAADMLRGANYTAELTFPLTGKAGPFKSYSLDLSAGGSTLAGFVSHGGDSFVSLPVLDGTILVNEEE